MLRRPLDRLRTRALRLGVLSLALALLVLYPIGLVRAASSTPVSGAINGPTTIGAGLHTKYIVTATGGPAFAPNGTQVGTLSFKSYFVAGNTTGGLLSPGTGVFVNGTLTLAFNAPNITESGTIAVLVTSAHNSQNSTTNLTLAISIVLPLRLSGVLVVSGPAAVGPFSLIVTLDGSTVGSVNVPSLQSGATYPISFAFVPASLPPGWHSLAINLGAEHGLVTFAGGSESISDSFYVTGPAPNYTTYYVAGIAAFFGVIVIWSARVSARRRGRART